MKKKGIFISFEGGDGAGKTTLITALAQHLESKGHPLLQTRAPGGTPLGSEIRKLVLDKRDHTVCQRAEILLFLADRAQHVDEIIRPALEAGKIVLCDRFNDSTLAYQSGARGLDGATVRSLCTFACQGLEPDLTLYIDLDPEEGLRRCQSEKKGKDRIESEQLSFHQRIREAYHQIGREEPHRFKILDGSLSKERVFSQAMEKIVPLIHD